MERLLHSFEQPVQAQESFHRDIAQLIVREAALNQVSIVSDVSLVPQMKHLTHANSLGLIKIYLNSA